MDEYEVIKRLKEHLQAKKQEYGCIRGIDKNYCLHYVMDFLLISQDKAEEFLAKNIPMVATP